MVAPRLNVALASARLFNKKEGKTGFAAKRGQRAREDAEREYAAGANLRPVADAPREFLDLLRQTLAQQRVVEAATLAEARDDAGGGPYFLLGLRMRRGTSVPFREVEHKVREALKGALPYGLRLECTDLDRDVDPLTADGRPNPYLVFEG